MNNCINIILDLQLITQLYHLATSFYLKGYNDYAAKKRLKGPGYHQMVFRFILML